MPTRILLSGLVFAISAAVMIGWYVPHFSVEHGVAIVDLQGWHSREQILAVIGAYTPAARIGYLGFLALDCIFPVAGSWFVIMVLRGALETFEREGSWLRWAAVFPFVAAVFDLLENAFEAWLTLAYPVNAGPLATLAWLCTSAKFAFLFPNYAVFGIAIMALASKQATRLRPSGS